MVYMSCNLVSESLWSNMIQCDQVESSFDARFLTCKWSKTMGCKKFKTNPATKRQPKSFDLKICRNNIQHQWPSMKCCWIKGSEKWHTLHLLRITLSLGASQYVARLNSNTVLKHLCTQQHLRTPHQWGRIVSHSKCWTQPFSLIARKGDDISYQKLGSWEPFTHQISLVLLH